MVDLFQGRDILHKGPSARHSAAGFGALNITSAVLAVFQSVLLRSEVSPAGPVQKVLGVIGRPTWGIP